MRFALLVLCVLALGAQQSKDPIEYCGLSSGHECHCMRRTQAIQDEHQRACAQNSKTERELHECMARTPGHCSVVDAYIGGDGEGSSGEPTMSDRCSLACKKHDCKCDDGPACHIAHSASDHADSKKRK